MKEIKVLGSGCSKCIKVAELIQVVANDCGVQVNVVKESSPQVMLEYGRARKIWRVRQQN